MFRWIKEKIKLWFTEEYELTIFFPGPAQVMPDGTRIESGNPKTYTCKSIKKITPKHIIFIDMENKRHEIKTVQPVGFNLKKIY